MININAPLRQAVAIAGSGTLVGSGYPLPQSSWPVSLYPAVVEIVGRADIPLTADEIEAVLCADMASLFGVDTKKEFFVCDPERYLGRLVDCDLLSECELGYSLTQKGDWRRKQTRSSILAFYGVRS